MNLKFKIGDQVFYYCSHYESDYREASVEFSIMKGIIKDRSEGYYRFSGDNEPNEFYKDPQYKINDEWVPEDSVISKEAAFKLFEQWSNTNKKD